MLIYGTKAINIFNFQKSRKKWEIYYLFKLKCILALQPEIIFNVVAQYLTLQKQELLRLMEDRRIDKVID